MFVEMLTPEGMPVQVPEISVENFRRRGYRPIVTPEAPIVTITEGETTKVIGVDVNSATAAELRALDQIGVKTAQAIIKGRPWVDLADLIQRIPSIEWLELESQLVFGDADS